MRKTILLFGMLCLCQVATMAQASDSKATQVAAIKKLAWMVGQWKGSGTVEQGPNKRQSFLQTENVQLKIDGTVLLVEGVGTSSEGQLVFNALAVIAYDAQTRDYRFRAFTREGMMTDASVNILDDHNFIWGFKTPNGHVRYTVKHTEQDQWVEIGEFSRDEKTWMKFFEMKLARVK